MNVSGSQCGFQGRGKVSAGLDSPLESRTSFVDPLISTPRHFANPFFQSCSFISAPLGLNHMISFTSNPRILLTLKYLGRRRTGCSFRNRINFFVKSKRLFASSSQFQLNQLRSLS